MPLNETVLMVDDDPALLRAHARLLKNHWSIVTAGTVMDAVERIAKGGISVVLTDWDMPGEGGRGGRWVLRAAVEVGIPAVVYSGGLDFADPAMQQAAGALSKPSSLEQIDRALWQALSKRNPER